MVSRASKLCTPSPNYQLSIGKEYEKLEGGKFRPLQSQPYESVVKVNRIATLTLR